MPSFFAAMLAALFVSAASAGGPQAAQTSQDLRSTPAGRRLSEVIELINSGDRAAAARYASENYGGQFRTIPMSQHQGFVSQVHDMTRGVDFHSFQDVKPNEVTGLLKSRLTGDWIAILVRVEADPPYRITGLGLRRPQPPAGAIARRQLDNRAIAGELDSFLKKLVDADVFSGSVLLAKNGEVIYKGAFGLASKDFNVPNRVDTKFNLGSMNKMFTAVSIAQLVEGGKLSFDDPLSKFLPDFPDAQSAQKIRIKNLLTHTSGLGSYFNEKFRTSSRALYRTVDEMIKLAADEKLAFEPGTKWAYSNTGFLVLGKVIEKVTGGSYYDYVREHIYRPAGMINSDCFELDLVTPNLALGYDKEFTDNGMRFRNNLFEHVIRGGPAGGGYSTAEDLLRFDIALRSNKLVGAEYVKLLLSPKPDLNSPDYGYGFQIDRERKIAGHGGGFPGISSNLDMFLESGYTAVVMSNYGSGSRPVAAKMQELIAATTVTRSEADAKVRGQ
jgi:CubicO group peptidase (beta-lactamase class C family)